MRKVYQLIATGPRAAFDGMGTLRSKTVYLSREVAEAAIPVWKARCEENTGGLGDLEKVEKLVIAEYDLNEEMPDA